MKTYIVQLENHDDVISARDKISWSKANRVLLVWPRKGRVMERRVDLLLLQRHCKQLGAQLALVTQSGEVKAQAAYLGIPVFQDAEEAQEISWRVRTRRKSARRLLRSLNRKPADPQVLREQRLVEQCREAHATPADGYSRAFENRWVRLGIFTLGVLAFLSLALAFAPRARVDIKPVRKTQQLTIAAWASPEIHVPNASGGFPAQEVTAVVEGRDEISSSGLSSVPDRYATGLVMLNNLTGQPVDVPQGSVLLAMTGQPVQFTTTQDVRVPAGAQKSVMIAVRAALPGSAGNVAAGKIQAIEGSLGPSLLVNNPQPASGGTDQFSRSPSSQDYQKLREKLLAGLQANALDEMRTRLEPGRRLLDGTIHLRATVEETREPPEGQPGDRLQLALRIEFEALSVSEMDLQAVALAALEANREKGFQPVPGSLALTFASEPKLDPSTSGATAGGATPGSAGAASVQTARWSLKIERVLEAGWNKEAVVSAVQGKGVAEAKRVLQSRLNLAEAPAIYLYPGWWKRLPFLPARIEVVSR